MQPTDNSAQPASSAPSTPVQAQPDRDLAVALMRQQINQLYDSGSTAAQPATEPAAIQPLEGTYEKTHDEAHMHDVSSEQWKRYHTAWQQYYQQYYERYYVAQTQARQQHITGGQVPAAHTSSTISNDQVFTTDKAISEIRSELTEKIHAQTKKIRKSRHFMPVMSALAVMLVFLFLQFNELVAAQVKYYLSPGSINPQNVIIDPSASTAVSNEPRIIIPKINVDAPVVYDVATSDEGPVQAGLHRGVVHYKLPGASALPGEKGNTVFLGHSSGSVFNDNAYKFIFVQLEQVSVGDKFYLHYNGTRYTYNVTSTETILPTEVSKLITAGDKPTATLVTCTPVGTNYKRFIVHADQISPDPNAATQTAADSTNRAPAAITGNPPSFFERLFGF